MSKGKIENEVFLIRGNEIIERFSYSEEKGQKMPAKAADTFLRTILNDKDHMYHKDLVSGNIQMVSGHPKTLQPRAEMTL